MGINEILVILVSVCGVLIGLCTLISVASNSKATNKRIDDVNARFGTLSLENEQKLEQIRQTMERKMTDLTADNNRQLEQMRNTVDEKLQKTLESRIGESFKLVNDRLEQVYKGLGEMQNLAVGVGDLKKVLTNVKTRGTLGEVQLGAILEQILSPEQYDKNVETVPGTNKRVEYAVKLPGNGEETVWLPIDAKFPGDTYARLVDAYDKGNPEYVEECYKELERVITNEAKDIHEKYISIPHTTEFGILFLPFEGLYAEVVRRGLIEKLQQKFKVNIAGPTTMAALLNSLQMGFRTLAIEKHSTEVWDILGAVKTEFAKFEEVINKTQKKINEANAQLDELVGVRTRTIQRKLRNVSQLEDSKATELLGLTDISPADYIVDDEETEE